MKIIIVKNSAEGGKKGFEIFKNELDSGAKVFGLATGGTPVSTYDEITSSDMDFSKCISINLDEYVGLDPQNDQSYHYYMNKHLFSKKHFAHNYLPNGMAKDIKKAAKDYDQIIADHPIDLQLLGIGRNGHIGFNEPGSSFEGKTHEVKLTESTIEANSRFFDNEDEVPRYALSMGIGSIMTAKKILLEAYGEHKADAIKATVEGPVTEDCPASVLQKHPDATLIIDEAAASKLSPESLK